MDFNRNKDIILQTNKQLHLVLPYPKGVSVNNCWKFGNRKVYLNPLVSDYRVKVIEEIKRHEKVEFNKDFIEIDILVYPPDNRKRDIDNILKVLLDSLQHAGLFVDDSQIYRILIERKAVSENGLIDLLIKKYL